MGKNRSGISMENSHPGCMWHMFHVLHRHRWHNVKKMLPHKKHGGGRHNAGVGNSIHATRAGEMEQHVNAEMENSLIVEKTERPSPATKTSVKSRIKAFISEEMSKRRGRHCRSSSLPTQIQLTRTNSLHHLEPSNLDPFGEAAPNDESPRNVHQAIKNTYVASAVEPLKESSSRLGYHTCGHRAFKHKLGLTKSLSFPLHGSSEHKTESCGIEEGKLQGGIEAEKSAEFVSTNDMCGYAKPYLAISESFDTSSRGKLNNRDENKVGVKRFKNLRQKIKHVMKESRKESLRITMDAVFHKIPHGRKFSKYEKEETAALRKGEPQRIKRNSSFNESFDRYNQLYNSSFKKEPKYPFSERLKLRSEETTPSRAWNPPKSLGRIFSLPELGSYSYLQNEDSPNSNCSRTPSRTVDRGDNRVDEANIVGFSVDSANETLLDAPVEGGNHKNAVEVGESDHIIEDLVGSTCSMYGDAESEMGLNFDDPGNLTTEENVSQHECKIQPTESCPAKFDEPSPIVVVDSGFQEDIISPANFSISEDVQLEPRHILFDCADTLDNALKSRVNLEKLDTPTNQFNSDFPRVVVDTKYIAEFNYVREILNLSGFTKNEFLRTSHSVDQQVDPTLFEKMCTDCEEVGYNYHLLLFNLINEVSSEIHARSFTYLPMKLSSRSRVLEEVWARIRLYLSWRPGADQSLDDAVSCDLGEGDRWMNLRHDAECVGLEVEDMIVDDLLEELIWT